MKLLSKYISEPGTVVYPRIPALGRPRKKGYKPKTRLIKTLSHETKISQPNKYNTCVMVSMRTAPIGSNMNA